METENHHPDTGLTVHLAAVAFEHADRAVREELRLSTNAQSRVLASLGARTPGVEAVVVCTDTTTELYVVCVSGSVQELTTRVDDVPAAGVERLRLTGVPALRHLFDAVSHTAPDQRAALARRLGLARQRAVEAGTLGPVLQRVLDVALGSVVSEVGDADGRIEDLIRWYGTESTRTVTDALVREAERITRTASGSQDSDHALRELGRAVRRLVQAHIITPTSLDEAVGSPRKDIQP